MQPQLPPNRFNNPTPRIIRQFQHPPIDAVREKNLNISHLLIVTVRHTVDHTT
jgi:hypothetical protein